MKFPPEPRSRGATDDVGFRSGGRGLHVGAAHRANRHTDDGEMIGGRTDVAPHSIIVAADKAWQDRRGVAAMEAGIVFLLLIGLLLPVADFAVAALQYVGAYQALRDMGAYAQVHPPKDVTNLAGWSLPTISGYTGTTQVLCGAAGTVCSAANSGSPKIFSFTTTITITPMFLTGLAGTQTIAYSERFQ